MKKSIVALLHIGFWMCYFVLIFVMLGMYFQDQEHMDERIGKAFKAIFLFAIVPSAMTFYSFYLLLFPKFLQQKKYLLSLVYGLSIAFGSALFAHLILYFIYGTECGPEGSEGIEIGMVFFMTFISLVSGIVALVIRGFITWFGEIKLKEALKQKNHEMELALVKSQLDPHFLFNTLNNIDVLILKDAEEASNYLNKLSDIMRFMLFETKANEISLSKEIEYIKKYIELQKIRTSNKQYVHFEIIGNPKGKMIAPMVFIPFIENAFKHTNNKKLEKAIEIQLVIEKEWVKLKCRNKYDPNRQSNIESNGLGNTLITKRLELLYPNKHQLRLSNENNVYKVELNILCNSKGNFSSKALPGSKTMEKQKELF